jgi:hypothetical protein
MIVAELYSVTFNLRPDSVSVSFSFSEPDVDNVATTGAVVICSSKICSASAFIAGFTGSAVTIASVVGVVFLIESVDVITSFGLTLI